MHPTPGPSPWLKQRRERGGDRYTGETLRQHFDPIDCVSPPLSRRRTGQGEGPGVG